MGRNFIKANAEAFWRFLHRRKAVAPKNPSPGPVGVQPSERFEPGVVPKKLCSVLPSEIIAIVVSFLPTSSNAALALCNHRISGALGGRYWNLLRFSPPPQEERAIFLQWLARDLPDHLFCDDCKKLHLHCGPGEGLRHHQCAVNAANRTNEITHYYHPGFQFEHVKMAMKLHRWGRDTKAYLARLAPNDTNHHRLHNLRLFEARIVDHEFFVCIQHWVFVPNSNFLHEKVDLSFEVCHHLTTKRFRTSTRRDNKLESMLFCKVAHLNEKQKQESCEIRSGLSRCEYCHTDFQIDLKTFVGRGTAVVVTKWMNLGAGRSRSDPKWQYHLENHIEPQALEGTDRSDMDSVLVSLMRFRWNNCDPVSFKTGSVKAAFEQEADFAFDSLATPKDITDLLSG